MNCVFNLPDLALWSTTVGRWIHDDCIIGLAAPDLALNKFGAVIHDPADRPVLKPGDLRVFLCPEHHALGRINVANARARSSAGDGRTAGIGKQVQHPDGPPGFLDLLPEEIPVFLLLLLRDDLE